MGFFSNRKKERKGKKIYCLDWFPVMEIPVLSWRMDWFRQVNTFSAGHAGSLPQSSQTATVPRKREYPQDNNKKQSRRLLAKAPPLYHN